MDPTNLLFLTLPVDLWEYIQKSKNTDTHTLQISQSLLISQTFPRQT